MSRTVTGAVRVPLLGDGRQMAPGRTFDCPYGTGPGREGRRPPRAPCSTQGLGGGEGTGATRPDTLPRGCRGRPGRALGGELGAGRGRDGCEGREAVEAARAGLPPLSPTGRRA